MNNNLKINFMDGRSILLNKAKINGLGSIRRDVRAYMSDSQPPNMVYQMFREGEEDALDTYNSEDDVLFCLMREPNKIYSNVYKVGAKHIDRVDICGKWILVNEHTITKTTDKYVSMRILSYYEPVDKSSGLERRIQQDGTSIKRKKKVVYIEDETEYESIYNQYYRLRASNFYTEH